MEVWQTQDNGNGIATIGPVSYYWKGGTLVKYKPAPPPADSVPEDKRQRVAADMDIIGGRSERSHTSFVEIDNAGIVGFGLSVGCAISGALFMIGLSSIALWSVWQAVQAAFGG